MKVVAGVFSDRGEAQRTIEELRTAGVDPQRVSVVAQDPQRAREVAQQTGAETVTGTAAGAGLGALLGGTAGWLVGIGALAIPGIGPVLAAGPIAAALGVAGTTAAAGAGMGAAAGGLVGALTGWGFSESEAREYESRVRQGDLLVTAQVEDEAAGRCEEIFRRHRAVRPSTSPAR